VHSRAVLVQAAHALSAHSNRDMQRDSRHHVT